MVWFLVKYVLVTSCHATLRLNTPDVTALPEYSLEVEGKKRQLMRNCSPYETVKRILKKYIYIALQKSEFYISKINVR